MLKVNEMDEMITSYYDPLNLFHLEIWTNLNPMPTRILCSISHQGYWGRRLLQEGWEIPQSAISLHKPYHPYDAGHWLIWCIIFELSSCLAVDEASHETLQDKILTSTSYGLWNKWCWVWEERWQDFCSKTQCCCCRCTLLFSLLFGKL